MSAATTPEAVPAGPPAHSKRPLVALLIAQAISVTGSRVGVFAVPWLVLVTTGSAARMGVVAAAEALPYIFIGVFAAPLIDRVGARRMTVLTASGSALAVCVVALGYRGGLGLLAGLMALAGAMQGLGDRSRSVLLRPVMEQSGAQTIRVTAAFDAMGRVTMLIGAPLGGVLIAVLGPVGVIWIDAASFAACALIVATLVRVGPAGAGPATAAGAGGTAEAGRGAEGAEPYLRALRAGVTYLRGDRLIRGVTAMVFVTNICNQAINVVLIPLWVREVLHSPAGLGLIAGAFAVGGLLGNITFTALATRLPRYLTFTLGYLIGGAPRYLLLGASDDLAIVLVVFFLSGVALSSVNPTIGVMLYNRVPAHLQARVFGLFAAFAFGGFPIGALLGGWTADHAGLTRALVATGLVYLAATLAPVIGHRTWRELDRLPAVSGGSRVGSAPAVSGGSRVGSAPAPRPASPSGGRAPSPAPRPASSRRAIGSDDRSGRGER